MKIGNLTLNANTEANTGPKEQNVEQQEENESGQEADRKVGPWKKIDPNEAPEEPKVEKKVEAPPPKPSTGSYVPPGLRGASSQPQVQPSRFKSKTAPDIHNEESFPILARSGDFKKYVHIQGVRCSPALRV